MEVNVVDASRRFARQARRIKVGDVVGLGIEQVQDIQASAPGLVELVSGAQVDEHAGARAHTVVFDQRIGAEVTELQSTRPGAQILYGGAETRRQRNRTGDVIACGWVQGINAGKAR